MGSRRFSIEMSEEFLKAHMRLMVGILGFGLVVWNVNSRIIDINGAIPLPPLIITSDSYLKIMSESKYINSKIMRNGVIFGECRVVFK